MNDGELFYCVHYGSGIFDSNTVIWWHFNDDEITEISDFPEGVYTRESYKNISRRK